MDTTTLLIIIIVVLVVAFLMSRNRGMLGGPSTRSGGVGPERPTYDDPDYTSSGSIGGADAPAPTSHRRNVGSVDGGTPASGRTNDDPNYRSGGSIGGA